MQKKSSPPGARRVWGGGGVKWNFTQMDADLPPEPQNYFARAKPNSSQLLLANVNYSKYHCQRLPYHVYNVGPPR